MQYFVADKVLKRIDKKLNVDGNGCWVWTGYMNGPTPTVEVNRKRMSVKAVVYVNKFPDEFREWLDVAQINSLNICDNNLCCNPEHILIKGTEKYFWSLVDIADKDECWDWRGAPNIGGYGDFSRNGSGVNEGAHRLAHMYYYKTDNSAPVIMHKCDNRLCCNPHHLEIGTDLKNMRDKLDKGRHSKIHPGDVIEIKQDILDSGMTRAEIGKTWGVSVGLIEDIARLHSWNRDRYDKLPDGRSFREEMRKKHTLGPDEVMTLYVIRNKRSGKVYVGITSTNVRSRLRSHKSKLNTGNHASVDMIDDYRAYGWNSFYIDYVETISNCHYIEAERDLIAKYQKAGYTLYNGQSLS